MNEIRALVHSILSPIGNREASFAGLEWWKINEADIDLIIKSSSKIEGIKFSKIEGNENCNLMVDYKCEVNNKRKVCIKINV